MKFVCYIKISADNFSRITFIITKVSDRKFVATPLQNKIQLFKEKLPIIYIYKTDNHWDYEFENDAIWLVDNHVKNLVNALIEKLHEEKKLKTV